MTTPPEATTSAVRLDEALANLDGSQYWLLLTHDDCELLRKEVAARVLRARLVRWAVLAGVGVAFTLLMYALMARPQKAALVAGLAWVSFRASSLQALRDAGVNVGAEAVAGMLPASR